MRKFHSFVLLSALTVAAASLAAMDNSDLLKLKQAGFSDETIIHSIDKETPNYDTSPNALIELKKAGISEVVINRILARQNSPASSAVIVEARPANSGFGAPESTAAATSPPPSSLPAATEPNLFSIESPSIAPPAEEPVAGKDYFTRFSFHQESNKYPTTNYARGTLVPINTPVHIVAISGHRIALKRLDNGEPLYVENVEKYSRKSAAQIASLMFSSAKTPIDRLAPPIANAILVGEMRKGMTKEQVLLARGYPPGHETPSTDGDRWVYWSSRFIKQTILFTNGRLTEGRQIE